jgi:hypothetical protein
VRRLGLPVTRQEQERARETLFAGVEELVDEVFFDPDVSRQLCLKNRSAKAG